MMQLKNHLLKIKSNLNLDGLLIYGLLSFLLFSGCTISAEQLEFDRAQKASAQKQWEEAVSHYQKVIDRWVNTDRALISASEAARISHFELKKFPQALNFYKHLVLYSKDPKVRIKAQKEIAQLNFEQLNDYQQAVIEFQRLLDLPHSKEEGAKYQLAIARCYFYKSDFFQSQTEIDDLLKKEQSEDVTFEALLLRANIDLTTKKLDEAVNVLTELEKKYPLKAREEKTGLVLAVVFEEKKDYPHAIETLKKLGTEPSLSDFVQHRIRSLKERQALLPGAQGLHK